MPLDKEANYTCDTDRVETDTDNLHNGQDTTGMAFSIALAKQADLEQIVAIYNQSILTKKSTADLIEVTVADKQPWFEIHLQRPTRPIYVLKNDSGTVMAWGCFSDVKSRPAYDISAEISIYVHQQYHRRGLASLFLQWMLTQAPQLGIRNILALIFAHNQPSLALFSKFGFETWGTMPQVCDMQTFVADVVMLGKSVAPANNS